MKLQRIFRMSPSEIAYRGWQEASKTMERLSVTASEISHQPPCLFDNLKPNVDHEEIRAMCRTGHRERAAKELLQRFRKLAPARFFAGATDDETPGIIANHHASERQCIVETADAVCRGEFDILGYGRLSFGMPVDWHYDPTFGSHAPLVHWSRINPLDTDQVGDSKVVWELNRHQWLLDLGQAYRLTGEERYARVFAKLIREWMQNNPPGLGINWASSLEVAMRLISWCWALFLFRDSMVLTPGLFADMLAWIRSHACYIERHLSYYYSPNTHLTGEALGLFYVGSVLPELQDAERWRSLGKRILVEQIEQQVHRDGVYFEQSTRYQYYTVEIYLHFIILASRNDLQIPDSTVERVRRMLDCLLALSRPDGSMPQIGDADGGWLLPLVRRTPHDDAGLFSTGAALFNRADYAWAAGDTALETLWLLGPAGRQAFRSLCPSPPRENSPRLFPQGGYVVMRSHWQRNAHHMIVDTGPLGCRVSGGHGHADLLSVQCSAFGEPYIVDPGTYCYTADRRWRDYFRSSHAHSTVTVDGCSQAEPSGPFAWNAGRPSAQIRRWEATYSCELIDAEHNAYQKQEDPVTHRRRVLFVKPLYWVIVDDLAGNTEHLIESRYQFAPLQVAKEDDGWVRARGEAGQGMLLRAFSTAGIRTNISIGELEPMQGWISPNYGQRLPAPVLTYTTVSMLPFRMVTLLYPIEDPDDAAPAVTPFMNDDSIVGLVLSAETKETIRIDGHDIVIER